MNKAGETSPAEQKFQPGPKLGGMTTPSGDSEPSIELDFLLHESLNSADINPILGRYIDPMTLMQQRLTGTDTDAGGAENDQ